MTPVFVSGVLKQPAYREQLGKCRSFKFWSGIDAEIQTEIVATVEWWDLRSEEVRFNAYIQYMTPTFPSSKAACSAYEFGK